MADPVKDARIYEKLSYQEFNGWALSKGLRRPEHIRSLPASASSVYYRVPLPGQKVAVSGMRHRSNLNGLQAEVLPGKPDQFGRILVRIDGDSRSGDVGRTMLIQASRLLPLSGGLLMDDAMSVVTCSRTGSESALRVPASIASAATNILQSGSGSASAGTLRSGNFSLRRG